MFPCTSYHTCSQAEKFRSKAQKEDVFRSHQQYCRYLYYLGRIRAIQLEYTEARDCLQQVLCVWPIFFLRVACTCTAKRDKLLFNLDESCT